MSFDSKYENTYYTTIIEPFPNEYFYLIDTENDDIITKKKFEDNEKGIEDIKKYFFNLDEKATSILRYFKNLKIEENKNRSFRL